MVNSGQSKPAIMPAQTISAIEMAQGEYQRAERDQDGGWR